MSTSMFSCLTWISPSPATQLASVMQQWASTLLRVTTHCMCTMVPNVGYILAIVLKEQKVAEISKGSMGDELIASYNIEVSCGNGQKTWRHMLCAQRCVTLHKDSVHNGWMCISTKFLWYFLATSKGSYELSHLICQCCRWYVYSTSFTDQRVRHRVHMAILRHTCTWS